ncbi:MAG: hypothetical protein RLZZ69_1368 [Cyanobacteriota bacterium]
MSNKSIATSLRPTNSSGNWLSRESFDSISVEMVFRGIYHFSVAHHQGSAINDLVAYLTAPENQDLGVVKQTRSARAKPHLDLSPSPS